MIKSYQNYHASGYLKSYLRFDTIPRLTRAEISSTSQHVQTVTTVSLIVSCGAVFHHFAVLDILAALLTVRTPALMQQVPWAPAGCFKLLQINLPSPKRRVPPLLLEFHLLLLSGALLILEVLILPHQPDVLILERQTPRQLFGHKLFHVAHSVAEFFLNCNIGPRRFCSQR